MERLLLIGYLPTTAALLSIYLVYATIQKWNQRRTARRLGCQPVRSAALKNDPLGVRALWANRAAVVRSEMPLFRIRSMDAVGPNAHTVKVKFLMNEFLEIRDPLNIKTVLSTNTHHYGLGPIRGRLSSQFFGNNLFTHEGAAWKASRALIRPQFYLSQIADANLFDKHVRELFLQLDVDSDGWTRKPDLSQMFINIILDISSEFLFHYSTHSQNPAARPHLPVLKGREMPDMALVGPALLRAAEYMARISLLGPLYWLVPSMQWTRDTKTVMSLCKWFADAALEQRLGPEDPSEKGQQYHFLDEASKTCKDSDVLHQEVAGLLFAAQAATSALLGWVFVYLAREPSVYERLRAAVGEAIGLDSAAPISNSSKLRKCDYLQNCINEALRLGSPGVWTSRQAIQDTTLPTGGGEDGTAPVFIPKGTQVVLNFFALHHRPDLYGDDVEEFRPERWEDREEKGWEMCAFGGGPRTCIGQQFALNETSYVVARIVQRYDKIENIDPCKDIRHTMRFTNRSEGVRIRFHEAKASG
ncbi:MAG: hypothetical protein LQ352_004679 [Teloschistes flavicans]|nr:MAG: hypothetical protein LQ352_004679 [Teloschistes flavicans]